MNIYSRLVRPAFFALPSERAHALAHLFLKVPLFWRLLAPLLTVNDERLATQLAGITLTNPLALAAGWDKDCKSLRSLQYLGFGYLVGGTVTPEPRRGNPRPRLLRDTQRRALINALGFPGEGVEAIVPKLKRLRHTKTRIFVSVAAEDTDGFLKCHQRMEPWATAVELNISSPNTSGLKVFQEPERLKDLLSQINQGRSKPLFVKLPPIAGAENMDQVLQLASSCLEHGVNGFTAVNTKMIEEPRLKMGRGGLSGRPLFSDMLKTVEALRHRFGPDIQINACGGIFSAEDALAALKTGANSVQIMTAFNYEGPFVARHINKGILHFLEREGLDSLGQFIRS